MALGLWMLWRATVDGQRASGTTLLGWMLVGWGVFNLVEGLADHLILGLHHVREGGNELAWDLGFLAFGLALVAAGYALARASAARRLD